MRNKAFSEMLGMLKDGKHGPAAIIIKDEDYVKLLLVRDDDRPLSTEIVESAIDFSRDFVDWVNRTNQSFESSFNPEPGSCFRIQYKLSLFVDETD